MTKATEMARVSVRGGFHVMWGLVASTVISAIGTIFIARLLGDAGYGLYGIAVTAPTLIATARDLGITTAVVKFTAQYNSENSVAKIRSIFFSSMLFETVLGLILSIISFALSDFIAGVFGRPTIGPLIRIASFFILSGALVTTATAAFTGMEKLHINSIVQVLQATIKTALILLFVLLGYGTTGAVWGFSLSVLFAGIISVLLMYIMYRSLPRTSDGKLKVFTTIKQMLKYGLPLSIASILSAVVAQFYLTIMAIYVPNDALIGNYNVAQNFVVLITFFATPVTTMLFPAFSKLNPEKERDLLKSAFQFSVKYAALIVVPVTVMVMALAQPAIGTIFQDSYTQAPLFLALLSISYLYAAFGNLSLGNLLNGLGFTRFNMKLSLLTIAIGFPVGFLLISRFGIYGLIATTLTVGFPGLILGLRYIKRRFGLSVDWASSAKILFSSGVAGLLTYTLIALLSLPDIVELALGVIVFVIFFVGVAVVSRTVTRLDIRNTREIVNSLGPLRRPLNLFITLVEKLINITQK